MKKTLLLCVPLFCLSVLQAQVVLQQVKDINVFGDSEPWQLTVSNDRIFFVAHEYNTPSKLWVTDGTEANTQLLGPAAGFYPQNLTAFNNKVFFSFIGNDNNGELWVSDGTPEGTKLFADLYPGNTGSFPYALTVANGKLFFLANNPDGDRRLYASDGTPEGTRVLRNSYTSAFNGDVAFAVYNNNILFNGDNGNGFGYGLWKTDGVTTSLIKADVIGGATGLTTAELNGKLYLCIQENTHGNELWVTDGTTAGTQLVKNIAGGDGGGILGNGNPQAFITYNGKVYFSASDGVHGGELWATDGTEGGTQLVKDALPGADGSLPYANVVFNNKLYFASWQLQELWESDGTESGTMKVASLLPYSKFAAIWNNTMYLISGDRPSIYQSDGTAEGTGYAKVSNSLNPPARYYQSGSDQYFLPYKGDLYFGAGCGGLTNGIELVKLTAGALPLYLLSFTGENSNGTDILQWSTTNEINSASFVVEGSSDGSYFTPAGVVAAQSTAGVKNYAYQQSSALNPGGYYRLKMQDKDGGYSYSSILLIQRASNGVLAVYDGGRKQVVITNATQQSCYWQLAGMNGVVVRKGVSANAVITIPAGSLAPGAYMLMCVWKNGVKTVKLGMF